MNFGDIVKGLVLLFVLSIMFGLAVLPGVLILSWVPDWLDDRRKSKAKLAAAEAKEKLLAEREEVLTKMEQNLAKQQENLDKIKQDLQKKEQNQEKIEHIQERQQELITQWAQEHGLLPPQIVSKAPISLEDAEA